MIQRIKEWFVQLWWDVVDIYDVVMEMANELWCTITGHNWIEHGNALDLEPRYWCDKCGEERRL